MAGENNKGNELGFDPNQINDFLQNVDPDTIDNLKKMAMNLMGGELKSELPEREEKREKKQTSIMDQEQLTQEFVSKVAKVVSALSTAVKKDPYQNEERFLMAVKPFTGEKGQKFCDEAVKMLKLVGVAQYVLENKDTLLKG